MRMRTPVAVLWIAVVLLTALVPSVPALAFVALVTVFLILADASNVARGDTFVDCDDQPVSLLALALFRAPPSLHARA